MHFVVARKNNTRTFSYPLSLPFWHFLPAAIAIVVSHRIEWLFITASRCACTMRMAGWRAVRWVVNAGCTEAIKTYWCVHNNCFGISTTVREFFLLNLVCAILAIAVGLLFYNIYANFACVHSSNALCMTGQPSMYAEWAEIEFPSGYVALFISRLSFIFHLIFFDGWRDGSSIDMNGSAEYESIIIDTASMATMILTTTLFARWHSSAKWKKKKKTHKIDILEVSDWNADDYHQSVSHSVAHVRYPRIYLSVKRQTANWNKNART